MRDGKEKNDKRQFLEDMQAGSVEVGNF